MKEVLIVDITANLEKIKAEIAASLLKSPDPKSKVTMVAVTKNRNIEEIKVVLDKGHFILGENRVQELKEKYSLLPADIEWHLIGHLQRNKVKYIYDKVKIIHSLENYDLAVEINKRMESLKRPMECLVQVNPAKEESKFGLEVSEVIPFIEDVSQLPWLKIKGLMTIALKLIMLKRFDQFLKRCFIYSIKLKQIYKSPTLKCSIFLWE